MNVPRFQYFRSAAIVGVAALGIATTAVRLKAFTWTDWVNAGANCAGGTQGCMAQGNMISCGAPQGWGPCGSGPRNTYYCLNATTCS